MVNVTGWFYIGTAYGLAWIVMAVYMFRLRARRVAALRVLTDVGGSNE